MTNPNQTAKAQRFSALHRNFLITPTVWDPLSAVAVHAAGFEALATSSAALGQALGITSGERVDFTAVESIAARIVRSVPVPVSLDLEDGYPEISGGVATSISRIIDAGIVGANIEDAWHGHERPLAPAEDHARRIEIARQASDRLLPGFYLNARTDLFLQAPGVETRTGIDEALRRARLYLSAGADGIYIPARALPEDTIAALAEGIQAPLTLVATEGTDIARWRDLGVARISLGTLGIRHAFGALVDQLKAIRSDETIAPVHAPDIDAAIRTARAL